MTELEYGIKHVNGNLIFSKGMNREEADEWIRKWKSGKDNHGAFVIVYREILPWKELKE